MNKFEMWLIRRIARRAVMQGDHERRIIVLYGAVIAVAEFTEDNMPTIDGFMAECHEKALRRAWPQHIPEPPR